jgi:hypothetical protein
MEERVAILGCGPAGLLAAHAVAQAGAEPRIFSHKQRSTIGGAQYIHAPIPGISNSDPDGMLHYIKLGDSQGYAEKVYGSKDAPTSWDKFPEGDHPAWSMQAAYERLWREYSPYIYERDIMPATIEEMMTGYDKILCTIPAKHVCWDLHEHRFSYQSVMLADKALTGLAETIVYNGRASENWYRSSIIFGHESTEWSGENGAAPRGTGVMRGIKPLHTNCDCWKHNEQVHQLGRFGRWQKGVLVSDAYHQAVELMGGEWV